MKALDYIRVVLIEPTHPGNIGAAARAMANMGVGQLVLVRPRDFPSAEATARAAAASHVLDAARVVEDVDEAIADCRLVIGTTARLRSIDWPQLEPDEAMKLAADGALDAPVALLFGRESRGLTNEELDRCQYLVRIPVDDACSSLNLAAAVMVLLYELRKAVLAETPASPVSGKQEEPRATAEEMNHFYAHLVSVLEQVEFADGRTSKLHRKLTRLFNRAWPYAQEVRMLRGILTAVEEKLAAREPRT